MTNRRDEMIEMERSRDVVEEKTSALLYQAERLLDLLLDAEDTIEEQAKRIDLLETELGDAEEAFMLLNKMEQEMGLS